MAGVLRGEIYWADLEPIRGREQGGVRPVLILSHAIFNQRSETVIVMAITSRPQRAGFPFTWHLPAGVLPRESWIKVSQVRTLSIKRLGARLAALADRDVQQVLDGLWQIIG